MTIYIASDHAGFGLKGKLVSFVRKLGHEVIDLGPVILDPNDDYPLYMKKIAKEVSADKGSLGIAVAGSGEGEAMVLNRTQGIRAAVYYGETGKKQTDAKGALLSLLASTRAHNDANVLSIGARFMADDEVERAIQEWIETPFSGDERHVRRIAQIDA